MDVGAGGRDRRGCGEAAEGRFRGMAGTALKRLMAEYKRESGGSRLPVLFPAAYRRARRSVSMLGRPEGARVRKAGLSLSPARPSRLPRGRPWAQMRARPARSWSCDPDLVPESLAVCTSLLPTGDARRGAVLNKDRVVPVRWS